MTKEKYTYTLNKTFLKIISSFIIMILIIVSVKGQTNKKINYQINFGTCISLPYKYKIEIPKYDMAFNSNPSFGYFTEILVGFNFNNQFSIFTGVNYLQSNLNINNNFFDLKIKGKRKSSSLVFPLVAKYQFSKKLPVIVGFGTYFSKILTIEEKGTSLVNNMISSHDLDIKERYKSYDFGISGQVDFDLRISDKVMCVLFSKFNYGLINVMEFSSWDKWRNYNMLLGFGIKI